MSDNFSDLSGTGDSRESFAIETPIFIARQADSHESLEFPIRANHLILANLANRLARITPLSFRQFFRQFLRHFSDIPFFWAAQRFAHYNAERALTAGFLYRSEVSKRGWREGVGN